MGTRIEGGNSSWLNWITELATAAASRKESQKAPAPPANAFAAITAPRSVAFREETVPSLEEQNANKLGNLIVQASPEQRKRGLEIDYHTEPRKLATLLGRLHDVNGAGYDAAMETVRGLASEKHFGTRDVDRKFLDESLLVPGTAGEVLRSQLTRVVANNLQRAQKAGDDIAIGELNRSLARLKDAKGCAATTTART